MPESLSRLGFNFFFRDPFVRELHHFLDGAFTAAQSSRDGNEFFNDDGRAGDGLHDDELAALNAPGENHFTLAREERHRAHLAEIDADGVLRLGVLTDAQVEAGVGVRGEFLFEARFRSFHRGCSGLSICRVQVFMYFNSLALQVRQQVVDFLRRKHIWGKAFVDFIIEEIAALLADNQELLEITELVINGPRQECSSACWNGIILQATSKVFVFSGLRAAGLGLGGVCVLEVSQLRVGH